MLYIRCPVFRESAFYDTTQVSRHFAILGRLCRLPPQTHGLQRIWKT